MTVRVLLVDDHRMLREALAEALARDPGVRIVGQAASGREALEQVPRLRPDVLVLDIGLPDMTGIEVARQLRGSATKVLMLSAHGDKRFVQEAMRMGAAGYVSKVAAAEELARAVRAVAEGKIYLSPEVAAPLVRSLREPTAGAPPPASVLAKREREVLVMVAAGLRSAEIAERLGIKVGTVDVLRRNIARKLGLRGVAELTKYALREGLTSSYG